MTKVEFLKKLGHKIRILRDEKNLSQEKLAEKISIDRGHIGTIENGKADTRIYTVKQIANALEVDITELFNFTI
ncbi:MAG: helix-turn-helix transcriptional regulator [Candidatus Gastranaerophilaceae bacterium]